MKKIKYISLILLFLVLTSCKDKIQDSENIEPTNVEEIETLKPILIENLKFEINTDVNLLSLISDQNQTEIVTKDESVDTSKLGMQDLIITYKEDEEIKEYKFTIEIIDTTAPEIIGAKDITTTIGNVINLASNVYVLDNSKEDIKVTIQGEYNLKKEGTYKLKYIAVDSSGNKSETPFVLTVKKNDLSQNNSNVNNNQNDSQSSSDINSNTIVEENTLNINSQYKINYSNNYVQSTNDFQADSKQEIMNIIYTYLNEGADTFNFTCNYENCINDLQKLNNDNTLSYIQDFIHPYNTLTKIKIEALGNKITISGTKKYSSSDIANVENKINNFINNNINNSQTSIEKTRVFHDYLINITSYENSNSSAQFSAVGPLVYGKAVCEGYTHAMAIFLYKVGIRNYRISVPNLHTWNLVYIDGSWKHLDVTWDDPIDANNPNNNILRYDYFLIDSNVIGSNDTKGEHSFNKSIYKEA